jgi:hypothetical protein
VKFGLASAYPGVFGHEEGKSQIGVYIRQRRLFNDAKSFVENQYWIEIDLKRV